MNVEAFAFLRVLSSEVRALVSLLPVEQQVEWLRIHEETCALRKINPVTGREISEQSCDEAAEAAGTGVQRITAGEDLEAGDPVHIGTDGKAYPIPRRKKEK